MNIDNKELEEFIKDIDSHISHVYAKSRTMQDLVQQAEGDSDLYRKLSFYLTPSMHHWLEGLQAGNIRDLQELLNSRSGSGSKKKK